MDSGSDSPNNIPRTITVGDNLGDEAKFSNDKIEMLHRHTIARRNQLFELVPWLLVALIVISCLYIFIFAPYNATRVEFAKTTLPPLVTALLGYVAGSRNNNSPTRPNK